jgi:hypothetical protein
MLGDTPDEGAAAVYQGALDEISVERKARVLDRARAAYKTLHGRDLEKVEDLVLGEHTILSALPFAGPEEMPAALRSDEKWVIDPETGAITSSYYGHRYELNVNEAARDHAWKSQSSEEDTEQGSI